MTFEGFIPWTLWQAQRHYSLRQGCYLLVFKVKTNNGLKWGLGSKSTCHNRHAICKDLGTSPTYDQWSFSPVIRFLYSLIEPQFWGCKPQLKSYLGQMQRTKQKHNQDNQILVSLHQNCTKISVINFKARSPHSETKAAKKTSTQRPPTCTISKDLVLILKFHTEKENLKKGVKHKKSENVF